MWEDSALGRVEHDRLGLGRIGDHCRTPDVTLSVETQKESSLVGMTKPEDPWEELSFVFRSRQSLGRDKLNILGN